MCESILLIHGIPLLCVFILMAGAVLGADGEISFSSFRTLFASGFHMALKTLAIPKIKRSTVRKIAIVEIMVTVMLIIFNRDQGPGTRD